jgi:hypothetical protein
MIQMTSTAVRIPKSFSTFAFTAASILIKGGQPRTPINRERALSGFNGVPQDGIIAAMPQAG